MCHLLSDCAGDGSSAQLLPTSFGLLKFQFICSCDAILVSFSHMVSGVLARQKSAVSQEKKEYDTIETVV